MCAFGEGARGIGLVYKMANTDTGSGGPRRGRDRNDVFAEPVIAISGADAAGIRNEASAGVEDRVKRAFTARNLMIA